MAKSNLGKDFSDFHFHVTLPSGRVADPAEEDCLPTYFQTHHEIDFLHNPGLPAVDGTAYSGLGFHASLPIKTMKYRCAHRPT